MIRRPAAALLAVTTLTLVIVGGCTVASAPAETPPPTAPSRTECEDVQSTDNALIAPVANSASPGSAMAQQALADGLQALGDVVTASRDPYSAAVAQDVDALLALTGAPTAAQLAHLQDDIRALLAACSSVQADPGPAPGHLPTIG